MAVRTVVVWCPDWSGGVRRGLRRREAPRRCTGLVVLPHDPAQDARAFEPVVAAVEELAPGVEVLRPGVCAVAARGPARYFGGDQAVVARLGAHVTATVPRVTCAVGVADGRFAAGLAARQGAIVPRGESRAFLAPFPVDTLESPELTDLLRRLGLRTLGAFAELPPRDVLARFGPDGARAHRLARGLDERPLAARTPPPELSVQVELDPPVERVDIAAFAARSLAEELHDGLNRSATSPAGAGAGAGDRPTAGITLLRLTPDEVVRHSGLQLGLWGGLGDEGDRAGRALARVQGMLGPDAVLTAVLDGGRGPDERIRLVPWGGERVP